MSRWLAHLNTEQREAALHDYGPLLILAGAGSGKTTVLVSRAGRLIEDRVCTGARLCVLTFTNKAASELKLRVQSKLGGLGAPIWAGTFHSFGLFLLRSLGKAAGVKRDFGIVDATDAAGIAGELMSDFKNGKTGYDSYRLIEMLSAWRAEGRLEARKEDEYEEATQWLMPRYLKRLDLLGVVDFDGLLQRPLEMMDDNSEILRKAQALFDQVMVDEFQDTNALQMKLVRRLSANHLNLAVVGDDDQAIYGWRGACVRNILDFPKTFSKCRVVRLETNYRSLPAVLNLANAIIANNIDRHPKKLRPHLNKESMKPELPELPELIIYGSETEEAEGVCAEIRQSLDRQIPPSEIAVLYRSNSIGASLEAELRKNQIAYAITGGTAFFDRKETRDVLAYIRLAFRPTTLSFRRAVTAPPRGIGETSLELLEQFALKKKRPLVSVAREWEAAGLPSKAGNALSELFGHVDEFSQAARSSPEESLLRLMERCGYRKHLERVASNAIAASKRWRFVEIFADVFKRSLLRSGDPGDFIDAMELRDEVKDEAGEKVNLMTLHACKGLEFRVVILVGVEEDLLPHRSLGSDVAEERRLFYVGVTRAKETLILTRTNKRNRFGREVDVVPSRFLMEISKDLYSTREGVRFVSGDRRKALLSEIYKNL